MSSAEAPARDAYLATSSVPPTTPHQCQLSWSTNLVVPPLPSISVQPQQSLYPLTTPIKGDRQKRCPLPPRETSCQALLVAQILDMEEMPTPTPGSNLPGPSAAPGPVPEPLPSLGVASKGPPCASLKTLPKNRTMALLNPVPR